MKKQELKIFGEVEIGNTLVKVFIEPDIDETYAKEMSEKYLEDTQRHKIINEDGTEEEFNMDFLIVSKNGITGSKKGVVEDVPVLIHLKNMQLVDVKIAESTELIY